MREVIVAFAGPVTRNQLPIIVDIFSKNRLSLSANKGKQAYSLFIYQYPSSSVIRKKK